MRAEDLDDTQRDDSASYRGPGRRRPSTGPVDAAYADADITIPCPDCNSPAYQYCLHRDGSPRRVPCGGRRTPAIPKLLSNNNSGENHHDA